MEILKTVPGKRSLAGKAAYAVLLALTVCNLILFFATAGRGFFFLFLAIGLFWYVFFFRARYEYDYVFSPVDGEFEVARITNRRKRKKLYSFYLEKALLVARADAPETGGYRAKGGYHVRDFVPAQVYTPVYEIYVQGKSGLTCMRFEPGGQMVDAMKEFAPEMVVK